MSDSSTKDVTIDETSISKSNDKTLTSRQASLEKHLQQRPDVQELKDHHILLDTNVAPSIQLQQKELEKKMRTDTLNKKLANRPDSEELVKKGILSEADRLYEERIEEEYAKREGGA